MSLRKEISIRSLVLIPMFSILIAVCAWIAIPTVIPFSMQTFAVFLALNFLGSRNGIWAIAVYLLMGLIGVPVFANGTSGISVLLGPTGGYMIGWFFSGWVMGMIEKWLGRDIRVQALAMLCGLLVCYLFGTAWFMAVYAVTSGPIGLWLALCWCVFPFVIPDLVKLGLALFISQRLRKFKWMP